MPLSSVLSEQVHDTVIVSTCKGPLRTEHDNHRGRLDSPCVRALRVESEAGRTFMQVRDGRVIHEACPCKGEDQRCVWVSPEAAFCQLDPGQGDVGQVPQGQVLTM